MRPNPPIAPQTASAPRRLALVGLVGLWLISLFPVPSAHAADSESPNFSDYMRFQADSEESGRLETSVTRLRNPAGVQVTLYAAVHIGDQEYYETLDAAFKKEAVLLYEMIKDKDVDPARVTGQRRSAVSSVQIGLKNALDLAFQLDAIDYSAKNFVHADMDPKTLAEEQERQGESILGLMIKSSLIDQGRRSGAESVRDSFRLLAALTSPNRSRDLKLYLAAEMPELETALAGFDDPETGGSVLVNGRNQVAMDVLNDSIRQGSKQIGVFYGAAHMPDFERRLEALGFTILDRNWLTAWDISE